MGIGWQRHWWDGLIAAGLGAAYFSLYLMTLCRTVYWYDSAEYVAAAVTLGIPHPPGYPLYTLVGHAFTWLPFEPAVAVNAMSATFAAIAVALTFLVCRRLGTDRFAAVIGAGALGGGGLFWANAVISEVYCPALAVVALVIYLLLRSRQESRFELAALAAFMAGLGLGFHLFVATLGLGFGLLIWAFDSPIRRSGDLRSLFSGAAAPSALRRSLLAAAMAFLGSLIFVYLPLRAAQNPPLNVGNPSTLEGFTWVITGGAYKEWFLQDLNWLLRAIGIVGVFLQQLLIPGVLLSLAGAFWLGRRRPLELLAIALMAAGNLGFFFRYDVHDLEVFFLPTTLLLSCLVGAGAQALIDKVTKLVSRDRAMPIQKLVQGALLVFVAGLVVGNYRTVDLSDFDETDHFIEAIESTLPRATILLDYTSPAEWKMGTVFGMYVQLVLGQRTDVDILNPSGPEVVQVALRSGRPVYAYVPEVKLVRHFAIAPDGPVYRVLGPRQSEE